MLTRRLEEEVARWSDRSPVELDSRSRALRDAGLLLVTGRGPYAASNGPEHIKNYILGLAGRKATDAVDAVKIYDSMLPIQEWVAATGTLGDAISAVLGDPFLAEKVHAVVLAKTGGGPSSSRGPSGPSHFGQIILRDPQQTYVYVPRSWAAKLRGRGGDDRSFGVAAIRDEVVIGGGWLAHITLILAGGSSSLLERAARESAKT